MIWIWILLAAFQFLDHPPSSGPARLRPTTEPEEVRPLMHQMVYDACDQPWHFDVPQRGALMLGNTHHTPPTFAMALGVVAMEKIHTPEGQLTERSMINELSHLELKQQNPGGHD